HLFFHLLAQVSEHFPAPLEQLGDRDSADPRRRPEEYLRCPVIPDYLCLDMCRVDAEMFAEVDTEALAVEISAGTQHNGLGAPLPCDIRERIRRIGHDEQHRPGRGVHDLWNDIAINPGVLFQQPETALRIVAIGGSAGLFVHPGGDQYDFGTFEIAIVAVSDIYLAAERDAVSNVGRHGFGGFSGAGDQDKLACAAARGA